MECPVCKESYNSTRRIPKLLPECKDRICLKCLEKASKRGEIKCPFHPLSYAINSKEDASHFKTDDETVSRLNPIEMQCKVHSHSAKFFCKTHLEAVCKQLSKKEDCDYLPLPDQRDKIRFFLAQFIRDRPNGLCPNEFCADVRRNPFDRSLEDLLSVALWSKEELPLCRCGAAGYRVEMTTEHCIRRDGGNWKKVVLMVYCTRCKPTSEATLFRADFPFRKELISHIKPAFRWISFYSVPPDLQQFLIAPPSDLARQYFTLHQLFSEVSLLLSLQYCEDSTLPDSLSCLVCGKQASKFNFRMRRLPCTHVKHAACEDCLLQSETTVKCPFHEDWEFACKVQDLKPEIGRNTVFSSHYLAGKGRLMPNFTLTEAYNSADRFVDLFPPRFPLNLPSNDPCTPFTQSWEANSLPNQVECLTFRASKSVVIWGFGVGSRLKGSAEASISEVLLYRCDWPVGPSGEKLLLRNSELEEDPELCTDVYFQEGVAVGCEEVVTLKVKIAQGKDPVSVFHGNHLGAYEAFIGDDGAEFQVLPTRGVEAGEHLAGSESENPLLRLIYVS